jgi:hypothetical protein
MAVICLGRLLKQRSALQKQISPWIFRRHAAD